jgi:hypothetical protein
MQPDNEDLRRSGTDKASRLRWARTVLERKGRSKNCYPSWIVTIGLILGVLGILTFTVSIFKKVQSGHGLDTYWTAAGVEFTYSGALILLVLIVMALIAGFIIRYRKRLK